MSPEVLETLRQAGAILGGHVLRPALPEGLDKDGVSC
jgi:hypothetical protein